MFLDSIIRFIYINDAGVKRYFAPSWWYAARTLRVQCAAKTLTALVILLCKWLRRSCFAGQLRSQATAQAHRLDLLTLSSYLLVFNLLISGVLWEFDLSYVLMFHVKHQLLRRKGVYVYLIWIKLVLIIYRNNIV